MSGYFARLAQRSGDAAPSSPSASAGGFAGALTPVEGTSDIGDGDALEVEDTFTVPATAAPSSGPAVGTVVAVGVASMDATSTAATMAPLGNERRTGETRIDDQVAALPASSEPITPPPAAPGTQRRTGHLAPPPARSAPAVADAMPSPPRVSPPDRDAPQATTHTAPPQPAVSLAVTSRAMELEVVRDLDTAQRPRAEPAHGNAPLTTTDILDEAPPPPQPSPTRARATVSAHAPLSRATTTSASSPTPIGGGIEVHIGRIELEVIAPSPAPPAAAISEGPPVPAPRAAPTFNPHRYYLRGR